MNILKSSLIIPIVLICILVGGISIILEEEAEHLKPFELIELRPCYYEDCYAVQIEILEQGGRETELDIAQAESSFNKNGYNENTNGTNDVGIFAINSIHGVSDECRYDYKCNIKWALNKMAKEGYGAWYSSQHKWDKK